MCVSWRGRICGWWLNEDNSRYRESECKYGPEIGKGVRAVDLL